MTLPLETKLTYIAEYAITHGPGTEHTRETLTFAADTPLDAILGAEKHANWLASEYLIGSDGKVTIYLEHLREDSARVDVDVLGEIERANSP